jgi:signal transduction histidine kinase
MLATRLDLGVSSQEAFTLGLLHDLGKFALAHALPKSCARVRELQRAGNTTSWELEREIIGIDHCLAGRRLAQMWNLHPIICDVIWLHRQPLEAIPTSMPHRRLIAAIGMADAIARQEAGTHSPAPTPAQLAKQLGLDEAALGEITSSLKTAIDQRCEPLRDTKPANRHQYRQALQAANAQLAALNESLRQRTGQLDAQARAFDLLRNFFAALRPDSSIPQLLAAAAATLCNAISIRPAADRPVVAYSLSQGADGILAVRLDGSAKPQWKLIGGRDVPPVSSFAAPGATAAPFAAVSATAPAVGQDAYQAAQALLSDPQDLADWIDLPTYRHQPLVCAGGWVGGVFYRGMAGVTAVAAARTAAPDDNIDAIAGALALALAIVQGRSRAVALGEELASASQILGDTQNALAQARTISTISEMAAGAAHEINNPLAVISGRAQLMAENATDDEGRKVWHTITKQAQRISDIITALNDFANPQPPVPQPIDPAQLLHDAAAAFNSSDHPQAKSARVDIDVHSGTPVIVADRQQAIAVITELVVNAANAATDAAGIKLWAQPDPTGHSVLIGVEDDGPGMDQPTLAAAFTPFFSSQKAGRRRGLGLPTARRYVENNGGTIWLRSHKGQGTLVQVSLPAQKDI